MHSDTTQAIGQWIELIRAPNDENTQEGFRQIYRSHHPYQGELIFSPACNSECAHCIYPPNYAKYNRSLSVAQWRLIVRKLIDELEIRTFVYGGRTVTRQGIEFLKILRWLAPDARIGIIDSGISLFRFREQLAELELGWIDVSLDGLERDHDIQRNRDSCFRHGLEAALWLKENAIVPKVNILTCLTTINRGSVIPMIQEINTLGFKNFFITPVTVLDGYRPDRNLMVTGAEFTDFIKELQDAIPELDDAWVELNVFSADYMGFIGNNYHSLWDNLTPRQDCLVNESLCGNNDFSIRYYPSSLTGTREFIVNTNGNVIPPHVMAKGDIPKQDLLGNLLEESAKDIVIETLESSRFGFYWREFLVEKRLLKNLLEKYDGLE
uniref:Sulfatase maturation enzyme AslB, radical SAM superfamily n=1 Tax=Candidatus Kentrum sp. FW TaxID=2126338 RepID=A0A450SPJ2_9GAMM|nr:MAG: Sulfatase maturation enzyme AslB, radical SAM superfamily [Candidatus Kentron sp. FW]